MVHLKDFVVVVKCNGKVIWEDGSKIFLKNGSEYSLLLKNLSEFRACAEIFIDGKDVLAGNKLVIDRKSNIELSRFMIDGDLNSGKKFKISDTDSGGSNDPSDDDVGMLEIRFYKEKVKNHPNRYIYSDYIDMSSGTNFIPIWDGGQWSTDSIEKMNEGLDEDFGDENLGPIYDIRTGDSYIFEGPKSTPTSSIHSPGVIWTTAGEYKNNLNTPEVSSWVYTNIMDQDDTQKAVTIMGSISDQKFIMVEGVEVEQVPTIIKLFLRLSIENVFNGDKIYCSECGVKLRLKDKFCSNCGVNVCNMARPG